MTDHTRARSHSQCIDDLDVADAYVHAALVAFTRACWDTPDWMPYYRRLLISHINQMSAAAIAVVGARVSPGRNAS